MQPVGAHDKVGLKLRPVVDSDPHRLVVLG